MPLDEAVVIALGSSLAGQFAGRQALLEAALDRFADAKLTVVRRSSWWRSASWPDPSLPEYLNGLVLVETTLRPRETLGALRRVEQAFGRRRGPANAPRTLDLDLIAHGRTVIDEPDLALPHPRAHERLFVMGPLAEIAPDWTHPVLGKTPAELAALATVGLDATPRAP
ncbi:MAG TPA: 2-amino-4-hydroxy-6-hydroxymethyldihydropteridine diphosphokinase [Caulobacteraceae bacterium]|nr:2-amino-4-hydroxy-6-hydroxymethyldihydropteridine diphosphokinase [Caulobacteraceae bacterium]